MNNSLLLFVLLLIAVNSIAAQKKGIATGQREGTYLRKGNELIYRWVHYKPDGSFCFNKVTLKYSYDYRKLLKRYGSIKYHEDEFKDYIHKDPFISHLSTLARQLEEKASACNIYKASLALSFVQALPYQYNMGSYQRYAVETLLDMQGDCSDKSILFAAILSIWDIDCIFLDYPDQKHLAVGVWSRIAKGAYYNHRGRKYFYCETSSPGFFIGDQPDGYKYADIYAVTD